MHEDASSMCPWEFLRDLGADVGFLRDGTRRASSDRFPMAVSGYCYNAAEANAVFAAIPDGHSKLATACAEFDCINVECSSDGTRLFTPGMWGGDAGSYRKVISYLGDMHKAPGSTFAVHSAGDCGSHEYCYRRLSEGARAGLQGRI